MSKNQLSVKERISRAAKAYRKFCVAMANLSERQRRIVGEAIRKIEKKQMEKIRAKLSL